MRSLAIPLALAAALSACSSLTDPEVAELPEITVRFKLCSGPDPGTGQCLFLAEVGLDIRADEFGSTVPESTRPLVDNAD